MNPYPEEVSEACHHPNGRVYRIAGDFAPADAVPPEAIVGAWKVDAQGNIVDEFIHNPNYDPERWPSPSE
jgi:hypothetical protein